MKIPREHLYRAQIQRRGGGGGGDRGSRPPPLENHKNKGFLRNAGLDLKNHKSAKPAFNVGPSSARQGSAI